MSKYCQFNTIIERHRLFLVIIIVAFSLAIRFHYFFKYTPSEIADVGVTASHLDIAVGVINNEQFSFNLERHLWIEKNRDWLLDNPIKSMPNFSNSVRVPIVYMDPGYGVFIGYLYKLINRPIDCSQLQIIQIFLDIGLLFVLYSIGRSIGLNGIFSFIPIAVHGLNILLFRSAFQIVQDYFVIFLIITSIWLILYQPLKKSGMIFQSLFLFILGGIIPWVRALFLIYPLFLMITVSLFTLIKKISHKYLILCLVFFLGSALLYTLPRQIQFSQDNVSFSFGRPGCFWYVYYIGLHQFDQGPIGDELAMKKVSLIDPKLLEKPLITQWIEIDKLMRKVVIQEIESDPYNYVKISVRRFLTGLFPSFYSIYENTLNIPKTVILIARIILFIISLCVLIYVFLFFIFSNNYTSLILMIPYFYVVIISTPFYLQGRSLMPTLDLLLVFFVYGIQSIYKLLHRRHQGCCCDVNKRLQGTRLQLSVIQEASGN